MSLAASPSSVDPSRCPLCGNGNQCGVQAARAPCPPGAPDAVGEVLCWCMTVQVPASLRERLPAEARGRSCICPACVAAALRQTAAA